MSSFTNLLFKNLFKVRTYNQKRLLRGALLIAVIMIPLNVALLFTDGMISSITQKYITLSDGHIQIYDKEFILDDSSIISGDYVVTGGAIIYSKEATKEVKIKGVDTSYFNKERIKEIKINGPTVEKSTNLPSIMISSELSKELGVGIDDRVAFMLLPDPSEKRVRPLLAQISSIYSSGYSELDSRLIFMNISDGEKLFTKSGYWELLVDGDLNKALINLEKINDKVLQYSTWDQFNISVYQNFITSRQVIFLILVLILLVAAVYIASIAQQMVQDSLKEIAILKMVGSTNKELFSFYFGSTMLTVGLGTVVGSLVGILIGLNMGPVLTYLSSKEIPFLNYYLLEFDLKVNWGDLIKIVVTMGLIATTTLYLSLQGIKKISPLHLLQQK
ncbi:MAG: ABC transporter permease [Sphaerochaetaceae bacterium]